jgi:alpha-tubulin suppressor-like RCC1 family protein
VGTIANPNAGSTTITTNGNYSIRANFEETEATFYTLTVGVTGSGSTSPTAGAHTYSAGAVISISATPAGGYHFVNWTGNVGSVANVNAASTTITINGNYSITANLEQTAVTYYTLTMAATGGGTINPAVGQHSYAAGTVVPIIASAAGGYYFVNWTGSVGTIANVNAASTTITMNGNYSITANFAVIPPGQYSLTISSGAGGSVTSPGQGTFIYGPGTVVNLVAAAAGGYQFVSWTGNVGTVANVTAASTTITMNSNYAITANFSNGGPPVPYNLTISSSAGGSVTTPGQGTFGYGSGMVVNLVATPAGGYRFVNWTGNVGTIGNVTAASTTITMNSNYSITANFAVIPPGQYSLTISSTAGGSVTTPGSGSFTYGAGVVVNLVAAAAGGYRFVNWSGNVGTIANVTAASTTITMSGNYSIIANFAVIPPGQYSLTISSTAGGSVTVPGPGTFTYGAGAGVNLVAAAAGGYRFVNWTGNVSTVANVTAASTTITMNGNYSITANFGVIPPGQYSLTISSTAGGSVTTPGQGTFTYNAGTVVNLVASPLGGYRFVNWTGNVGTVANVTAASTTITMNGNCSITANFVVIPPVQYSLTISSTAGGAVTTPGHGTFVYNAGTVVNLVATPTSGYGFVDWTGNVGTIANVNAPSTTVTMNSNYSITANFGRVNFMVSAGDLHTVGLKSNGTVLAVGDNEHGQCNVSGWTDIIQVAGGGLHTVGLKSDGTVVATGNNRYGQCDVGGWTNIIQVAAGGYHTVGLKSDGTVVATGNNRYGQCDVGGWTNIIQVAAGGYHTVGLKSDGTVLAAGYNYHGQCDVGAWTNIIQVAAGGFHTVGLKSDGTVVATGNNWYGQCNSGGWTNIMQVAAGNAHTVGLKSNGTVVAAGYNYQGQCNVGGWTNIVQVSVSAGGFHTVGLRTNGVVLAAGDNYHGQCNVSDWTGIVQVTAGWEHTVGLKSDGTVVAVGWNEYGECNVGDWDLN